MNKIREIREEFANKKIIEIFYIIGILLLTVKAECNSSIIIPTTGKVASLLYVLSLIFMFPKVIFQKYNKKDLLLIVPLVSITIVCIFCSKTFNLITIPFAIIGIKNSDVKKIVKYILYITISVVLIHLIGYIYQNISSGIPFLSLLTFKRAEFRPTILFSDHNNFCILISCAIMQYIYITNRNQKKYIKFILLLLLSFFAYLLGQSITSLAVSILAILFIIIENNRFFNQHINKFEVFSISFSTIFSLSMPYINVDSGLFSKINLLVSDRIRWEGYAQKILGWSIFPQPDKYDQLLNFYVDNCFISFALKWGLLISTIVLIIIFVVGLDINTKVIEKYFLSIIFIWGIMENVPKLITVTFIPLVLFNNFFTLKSEENIYEDSTK